MDSQQRLDQRYLWAHAERVQHELAQEVGIRNKNLGMGNLVPIIPTFTPKKWCSQQKQPTRVRRCGPGDGAPTVNGRFRAECTQSVRKQTGEPMSNDRVHATVYRRRSLKEPPKTTRKSISIEASLIIHRKFSIFHYNSVQPKRHKETEQLFDNNCCQLLSANSH